MLVSPCGDIVTKVEAFVTLNVRAVGCLVTAKRWADDGTKPASATTTGQGQLRP